FVILSRGHAAAALAWTKAVMTQIGLTLNEAKTSLKNAREEHFDFLGYSFGPQYYKANGRRYLGATPSKKSVQRLKTKVGDMLVPSNNDPWPKVRDSLNSLLAGWSNYFCYWTRRSAFRGVDRYVYERVRDFLARRHEIPGRRTRRFSFDVIYGEHRLLRLARLPVSAAPSNLTCRFPPSGSRTRLHAFAHGSLWPSRLRRTSPKCPYRCLTVKPVGERSAKCGVGI